MAKNFKKTAIKTGKNEKKFKKSDSSVIARSGVTKQSRKRKCAYIGLLRYGMDCHVVRLGFSQ